MNVKLLVFPLLCIVIIYSIDSLISRELRRPNHKLLLLYITSVAMIGTFGEVLIGSLYNFTFHKHFWDYTVFPVHHAHTSKYAVVLWGIYGMHLCLIHGYLNKKKTFSIKQLSLIFSLEALLIEAFANFLFKFMNHKFLFYYLPSDLWHLTSIQTLPFYFVAGYVIVRAIQHFETDPIYYSKMCAALTFVLVFLT